MKPPYHQNIGSSFPPSYPQQGFGSSDLQPPRYPMSSRPSVSAIISLVLGILSPLFGCFCIPTIFLSLAAVILGHIAIFKISRSRGALGGLPVAIVGLVFGYLFLVISAACAPAYISGLRESIDKQAESNDPMFADARAAFSLAESKIVSDKGKSGYGNTPEAEQLANEYAKTIQELRDEFFTKSKGGASLSRGKFLTYCQLQEGKCCFLVHVPDYRNFEGEAKKTLVEIAWSAAQVTAGTKLKPGDRLGIGLKGILLYGSVKVGRLTDNIADFESSIEYSGTDEDELLTFFQMAEQPPEGSF